MAAIIRPTTLKNDGMAGRFPGLTITFDKAKLKQVEDELSGMSHGVGDAVSGAINKILPKFRTRLVRGIAAVVNLRSVFIRRRMSIKKATTANLTGYLRIREKKIELIQFGATQDKKTFALKMGRKGIRQDGGGVSIMIYKKKGRETFPHMFINKGKKSGRLAVFKRAEKGGRLVARYPIYTRYGPSMLEIVKKSPEVINAEMEVTANELNAQIDSQVDRFLKRRKVDR